MNDVSFHQLLVLYTWFPLAAMLALMLLIARLYQKDFKKRTFFSFYMVPIVMFGVYSVRSASVGAVDDVFSSLLAGVAGITLLALTVTLYRQMLMADNKK